MRFLTSNSLGAVIVTSVAIWVTPYLQQCFGPFCPPPQRQVIYPPVVAPTYVPVPAAVPITYSRTSLPLAQKTTVDVATPQTPAVVAQPAEEPAVTAPDVTQPYALVTRYEPRVTTEYRERQVTRWVPQVTTEKYPVQKTEYVPVQQAVPVAPTYYQPMGVISNCCQSLTTSYHTAWPASVTAYAGEGYDCCDYGYSYSYRTYASTVPYRDAFNGDFELRLGPFQRWRLNRQARIQAARRITPQVRVFAGSSF